MAGKATRRSRRLADESAAPGTVKKTFRLADLTAKRLGVESVMTGEPESRIVDRVLTEYLSRWRLPSKTGGAESPPIDPAARADDAA